MEEEKNFYEVKFKENIGFMKMKHEFERNLVAWALAQFNYSRVKAAKFLKMNRSTMIEIMKRYDLGVIRRYKRNDKI